MPDVEEMSRIIRIMAMGCKDKDVFSCAFGNEFAPKVEEYLRECLGANDHHQLERNKGERR